jgi:hypothetical protein
MSPLSRAAKLSVQSAVSMAGRWRFVVAAVTKAEVFAVNFFLGFSQSLSAPTQSRKAFPQ